MTAYHVATLPTAVCLDKACIISSHIFCVTLAHAGCSEAFTFMGCWIAETRYYLSKTHDTTILNLQAMIFHL